MTSWKQSLNISVISLSLTSLFRLHGGEASSSWGRCQPGDSKTSSSIFNSKSVNVCSSLILGGWCLGSCTCCCFGVDERRGIPCPSPCTGCGWCSRWSSSCLCPCPSIPCESVMLSLDDDHLLHANLDQETTWEGHASLVGEVAEALGRPPACIVTAVYTSSS